MQAGNSARMPISIALEHTCSAQQDRVRPIVGGGTGNASTADRRPTSTRLPRLACFGEWAHLGIGLTQPRRKAALVPDSGRFALMWPRGMRSSGVTNDERALPLKVPRSSRPTPHLIQRNRKFRITATDRSASTSIALAHLFLQTPCTSNLSQLKQVYQKVVGGRQGVGMLRTKNLSAALECSFIEAASLLVLPE